ncbi:MAG: alanine racemase, partial [Pseudomonadota bacterium]|nr:alanine racemase [Pseudomonadota bacterium]
RTQIIGRVCMDMLMIDLRGINARPGDQVTLWGEGLSVDEVARHTGTVGYELLSAVGGRANTEFSS